MSLVDNMNQAEKHLKDATTFLNALMKLNPAMEGALEEVLTHIESARSYLQDTDENQEVSLDEIFSVLAEDPLDSPPEPERPQFSPDYDHYMQERDANLWADPQTPSYEDVIYGPDGTAEGSELARTLGLIQDALEHGQFNNAQQSADLTSMYARLTFDDVARMSAPEQAAYYAWRNAMESAQTMIAGAVPAAAYQSPAQMQQYQMQQQQAMYEAQMQAMKQAQEAQAAEKARLEQEAAAARARAEQEKKEAAARAQAAEAARRAEITQKQLDVAKAQGNNAFIMPSREEIAAHNTQQQVKNQVDSYELDVELSDFDIDYVPFSVNEFEIQPNGVSSMYMECRRKAIGEWDVATLLTEEALDIKEFSIYGTLRDGTETSVTWSGDNCTVSSSVPASHGIGAIFEARSSRNQSVADIASVAQGASIVDTAYAATPTQAFNYLPLMDDVSYISVDVENEELFYTLWFADKSADIEVQWIQEDDMVDTDLGSLVKNLSIVLGVYGVGRGAEPEWSRPRSKKTVAGEYHDDPERYSLIQNRAMMSGRIIMNLKSLSIDETGQLKARRYTKN